LECFESYLVETVQVVGPKRGAQPIGHFTCLGVYLCVCVCVCASLRASSCVCVVYVREKETEDKRRKRSVFAHTTLTVEFS
jgi:hypothetical protein